MNNLDFELTCSAHRRTVKRLPYNEQYEYTFVYHGSLYTYDPDWDCFHRYYSWEELSHWDRWGWLYVSVILTIACLVLTPY